ITPAGVARVADAALCRSLPRLRPRAHQLRADRHSLVRPRIYRRHSLGLALCARDHPSRAALECADADDRQRLRRFRAVGHARHHPGRADRLRIVLQPQLLRGAPAGKLSALERRHVVSRRLSRLRACGRPVRPPSGAIHPFARRHHLRPGNERDFSRAHRQLHQRRALGPPDRPAVGNGVSDRRASAAPSEPTLRGGARGAVAFCYAHRVHSRRRAQAAGFHSRRLQLRLRRRALHLRTFSRARSPARLPVGRLDDGHAAVVAIDARRHRSDGSGHAKGGGTADMTDIVPLETEIRRRIAVGGAMAVAQYMELCLTDPERGYYVRHDPFGAAGDFTTAPEISQMFGELIGLWAAATWRAMGSPGEINLVELGPGRGTMMVDVLRAARVMPDFLAAIHVHLVEISPALERLQRNAFAGRDVPVSWDRAIEDVPDGAVVVLANEFFDALPIHQAVMCADGWHERVIKIGEDEKLHFSIDRDPIPLFEKLLPSTLRGAKIGEIFEGRGARTTVP